jgi:radical SAM protein with 4Fe4S-binding SPASM domain
MRFGLSVFPSARPYSGHEGKTTVHNTKQHRELRDENDFEDVWKNNEILGVLRNKEILKGNCGDCKSRNICSGCRARAYNYFDDILAPDPGCIKNENEWNKLKNKIVNHNTRETHFSGLKLSMGAKK